MSLRRATGHTRGCRRSPSGASVPGAAICCQSRVPPESICWICAEVTPVWQTGLSAETSSTSASIHNRRWGELLRLFARQGPIRQRYVLRLVLHRVCFNAWDSVGYEMVKFCQRPVRLRPLTFSLPGVIEKIPPASIENDSGMLIATRQVSVTLAAAGLGMVNANAASHPEHSGSYIAHHRVLLLVTVKGTLGFRGAGEHWPPPVSAGCSCAQGVGCGPCAVEHSGARRAVEIQVDVLVGPARRQTAQAPVDGFFPAWHPTP